RRPVGGDRRADPHRHRRTADRGGRDRSAPHHPADGGRLRRRLRAGGVGGSSGPGDQPGRAARRTPRTRLAPIGSSGGCPVSAPSVTRRLLPAAATRRLPRWLDAILESLGLPLLLLGVWALSALVSPNRYFPA